MSARLANTRAELVKYVAMIEADVVTAKDEISRGDWGNLRVTAQSIESHATSLDAAAGENAAGR